MTEPHLRVLMGSSIAMGPGKADLLQAIADAGSITAKSRASTSPGLSLAIERLRIGDRS